MFLDLVNNTNHHFGQTGRVRGRPGQATIAAVVVMLALMSCRRPAPGVLDDDPRLPLAFCSPRRTFATWVAASIAGKRAAIAACYWKGMSHEEFEAWMGENLRPRARAFFSGAKFLGAQPVTRVEVNFTYQSGLGDTERGVMVLTHAGWKIQRW